MNIKRENGNYDILWSVGNDHQGIEKKGMCLIIKEDTSQTSQCKSNRTFCEFCFLTRITCSILINKAWNTSKVKIENLLREIHLWGLCYTAGNMFLCFYNAIRFYIICFFEFSWWIVLWTLLLLICTRYWLAVFLILDHDDLFLLEARASQRACNVRYFLPKEPIWGGVVFFCELRG